MAMRSSVASRATGTAAAIGASLLLVGAALAAPPPPASLDFDRAFDASREPASQHYVATYRIGDAEHRLEVWRDGRSTLRRRTDDAIDALVEREPGGDELAMTVLDLQRRIRTEIGRGNLARMGHATDWFSLAHALARPAPGYRLGTLDRGPKVATAASCRWFELVQGEQVSRICWSAAQALPMAIVDGAGRVAWKVDSIDHRPLAKTAFVLDDRGFVRNDANADIKAD